MKLAIVRYFVLVAVTAVGSVVSIGAAQSSTAPGTMPPLQASGDGPAPNPDSWPREVKNGDKTFLIHQPQFDSWDGRKVEALSAIEVKVAGSDKVLYGAARATANVNVDKLARTVEFVDLRIVKAIFPGNPEEEGLYLRILQLSVMPKVRQMSLDLFETALAVMEAEHKFKALPLKNDPPAIIHSEVPAILVYVDGTPVYRPVKETGMERIINTRPLILKDAAEKFYLHLFDGWMEATALAGRWQVCKQPPSALAEAKKDAVASGQVDLLEGKADPEGKIPPPSLTKGAVPVVHTAITPTELIVTEGAPKFVAVTGTALEYAENTTGHVFTHTSENKLYVLISGRWFRSSSTQGPWEFVPGGKLPADFSKIPDDSPKENVKASIPGTAQALEAVIAAHIPQTATVNRQDAKMNPPRFDGDPQFKPLEGTFLEYVANTATPIIKVDAGTFYAVENGVWFKAASLDGPWSVADSIPAAIYTIPPSAPLHYVTYVKVYGSTPTTVDVGYTSGYYGTVVTTGSGYVAVYGTGYYYSPWIGSTWFGPPVTYGCGTAITYTPWDGWAFSFGFGWSWGYPMYPYGWGWGPYPWWGPVGWGYYYPYPYYAPMYGAAWGPGGAVAWGPGGWARTTGNVYHRYGNTGAVTRSSGGFNAWTGNRWGSQVGMSYNSRNGNIAAGQRGAVSNVYTGNYAYGGRGAVTSGRTGNTITGGRMTVGDVGSGQSGSAGYLRGEGGGTVARVGDDVYAGRDGNVYRRGESGWEQRTQGGWNSVDRPTPNRGNSEQIQSLDRQSYARSMGNTRTMSNRSFSGGGMRMGGGRRR
ncbi:MAG: autotransporter [Acidobacteria bacterium]|nr:MAG: autotransporter [Acidobacteriota bacterium]